MNLSEISVQGLFVIFLCGTGIYTITESERLIFVNILELQPASHPPDIAGWIQLLVAPPYILYLSNNLVDSG